MFICARFGIVTGFLVLATTLSPLPLCAQGRTAGPAAPTAIVSGTLSDPAGGAAERTLLTISGRNGNRPFFRQARTDDTGRFQFDDIPPGDYILTTPTTDFIEPHTIVVNAGTMNVDVHMRPDETAVDVRVCRDCRGAARPPAAPKDATPAETEIYAPAEPEEGWDVFNATVLPYPSSLQGTRVEGTVTLDGRINPDGSTGGLRVVSSSNPQLAQAALDLVTPRRWRAARVRGAAVETALHVTVEFMLKDDPWR
jgi:TonB family protein